LSAKILTNVIAELAISMVASNKRILQNNCLFKRAYSRFFAKDKDSIQSVKESYLRDNNIFVLDQFIDSKTNEKNTTSATAALSQRQIRMVCYK
jgi:hypothetical protein